MRTVSFEIEDDEVVIPHIIKAEKMPIIIAAFCEAYGYKSEIEEVIKETIKVPKVVAKENEEGIMETKVVEIDSEIERTVTKPNPMSAQDFAKRKHAEMGINFVNSFLDMKAKEAKIRVEEEIIVK